MRVKQVSSLKIVGHRGLTSRDQCKKGGPDKILLMSLYYILKRSYICFYVDNYSFVFLLYKNVEDGLPNNATR